MLYLFVFYAIPIAKTGSHFCWNYFSRRAVFSPKSERIVFLQLTGLEHLYTKKLIIS